MENGVLGEVGRAAIRHVELVLSVETDTVTALHLGMEEDTVLGMISSIPHVHYSPVKVYNSSHFT